MVALHREIIVVASQALSMHSVEISRLVEPRFRNI
jgi:hypothetical protein